MKLPAYKPKRARIEIIPMIDTIFFLLVYFIMAGMTLTQMDARKVKLPESETAAAHPDRKVIVTLASDNRCYIDRYQVAELDIKKILQSRLVSNPKLSVVINCDKNQPVARFTRLYDLVKQANPANVMIATTPKDPWIDR
jgi:biopolymer transport protein ExbD